MRAQRNEPIRVVNLRDPGTMTRPAPGVFVYDVGQNLTGWARLRINAPAGTVIEAYYGEQLTADGRVTDRNVLGGTPPTGFALVGGSCRPTTTSPRAAADEVWAPRFTYKGFQYVQLSAPERPAAARGRDV